MRSLEQALIDAEGAAETAQKSAARVVSQARALVKAARTGNVAAIKRCQASLEDLAGALEDDVVNACSCWPFTDDEEQRLFEEDYAGLLRDVADARGLKIYERDGLMIAYPSILRVLASERAVRVDRKKVSTINPSYLVGLLLANQKKSSGFKPHQFLESLYSVYTELLEAESGNLAQGDSGRVVPLARIQEHSKVVIQSDCGGIRQDAAVSDDCWRLVICGQGCRSRVRRSGLRDGSASMQCVLVGCGHTWCVAFCRLGVRISVSG